MQPWTCSSSLTRPLHQRSVIVTEPSDTRDGRLAQSGWFPRLATGQSGRAAPSCSCRTSETQTPPHVSNLKSDIAIAHFKHTPSMSRKRKRAGDHTSEPPSSPRPALYPAQPQPAMSSVHCQPTRDPGVFEACMMAQCPHCAACMDCEAMRDLTWQSDSKLRAQLSMHNASLNAKAAALDRVAASFNTTRMFQLQDQLSALQQQVSQLQQHLPVQQAHTNVQDEEGVTKVETMSDVGAEDYHTPPSIGDDEADLKRETSAEAIAPQHQRLHGIVVITEKEQRNARRAVHRIQRPVREQPVRESTLRVPRASIEVLQSSGRQSGVGGSVWTVNEDKMLLEGFNQSLSSSQIHKRYLPNRTADAIRKRKGKLQRG